MAVRNGNQKSTAELDRLLNAGQPQPIYNNAHARARHNDRAEEKVRIQPMAQKTENAQKTEISVVENTESQNSERIQKKREPVISARWIELDGKKLLYVKVDFGNEVYVRQIIVDSEKTEIIPSNRPAKTETDVKGQAKMLLGHKKLLKAIGKL
jgi:hypothetical protein